MSLPNRSRRINGLLNMNFKPSRSSPLSDDEDMYDEVRPNGINPSSKRSRKSISKRTSTSASSSSKIPSSSLSQNINSITTSTLSEEKSSSSITNKSQSLSVSQKRTSSLSNVTIGSPTIKSRDATDPIHRHSSSQIISDFTTQQTINNQSDNSVSRTINHTYNNTNISISNNNTKGTNQNNQHQGNRTEISGKNNSESKFPDINKDANPADITPVQPCSCAMDSSISGSGANGTSDESDTEDTESLNFISTRRTNYIHNHNHSRHCHSHHHYHHNNHHHLGHIEGQEDSKDNANPNFQQNEEHAHIDQANNSISNKDNDNILTENGSEDKMDKIPTKEINKTLQSEGRKIIDDKQTNNSNIEKTIPSITDPDEENINRKYKRTKTENKKIEDQLQHDTCSSNDSYEFTEDEDEQEYARSKTIPPELLDRFKTFPLFQSAPNAFFTELARSLRLVQHHPQEYIVKFGEPAKSMYWILRGTVGVTSTDGEAVYAELGAGSFFGEIGILFNRPRTATVVARTKVLLGVLTKDALSIVLSDFPIIERLIRDEGQERLAMQRKRKRPNRNIFQNNAFQRRETRNMSDHYAISASEAALEADNMPGPALPPISAVLQTPFVTSNAEQLMSPIGSQSNNSTLGNITNNNDLNGSIFIKRFNELEKQQQQQQQQQRQSNQFQFEEHQPHPYYNQQNHINFDPHNPHTTQIPFQPHAHSHLAQSQQLSFANSIPLNQYNYSISQHIHPSVVQKHQEIQQTQQQFLSDNIDNSISTREFLTSLPLFKTLPLDVLHELALSVEVLRYGPMECIFRKGDTGRDIYFVISGSVEVLNPDENIVLARSGHGKYFGEMAFLSSLSSDENDIRKSECRSADIRTIEETEVLVARGDTLADLCHRYPLVAEDMKITASERLKNNDSVGNLKNTLNSNYKEVLLPNSSSVMGYSDGPLPQMAERPLFHSISWKNSDTTANKEVSLNVEDINRPCSPLNNGNLTAKYEADDPRAISTNSPQQQQQQQQQGHMSSESKTTSSSSMSINTASPMANESIPDSSSEHQNSTPFKNFSFSKVRSQSADFVSLGPNAAAPPSKPTQQDRQALPSLAPQMQLPAQHQQQQQQQQPLYHNSYHNSMASLSSTQYQSYPLQQSQSYSSQMQFQPQSQQPLLSATASSLPKQRLSIPNMNPSGGSIYKFINPPRMPFQYTSHADRVRLHSVNGGRRRSSVLTNGPLSDSIFLEIFRYLELPELMRLSTVCRRWKQLLYLGSNLCNVLDLKPYNRDLDDKGLIQITNFVGSRPTVIDITNCYHISDESFSYLINEVGIKGCIKKLYMKNNWNISAMAIMDLAVPSVGHDLVLLDISNCRKVKDDVVERLIGWKDPDVVAMGMLESNNYNLAPYLQNQYRYLHEQNQMLKMNQFKNNAIGCPKLAYLNLSYCKYLTDKTMIHLSQHANDRLVSLNLTRCTTITDNGFSFWATTHFKNLKNLVLRDCTFLSDNAITSIAGSCPNLEVLDLTFCCVLTDNSLSILYLCCKKLKELNLSFCGSTVSNHSLASISRLPQLWKLIITGCVRVTRQGVDVLLATSQSITHLDLSQCPRVHMFQGTPVEPFERKPGTRNAYLKVAPHDRIVKVVL